METVQMTQTTCCYSFFNQLSSLKIVKGDQWSERYYFGLLSEGVLVTPIQELVQLTNEGSQFIEGEFDFVEDDQSTYKKITKVYGLSSNWETTLSLFKEWGSWHRRFEYDPAYRMRRAFYDECGVGDPNNIIVVPLDIKISKPRWVDLGFEKNVYEERRNIVRVWELLVSEEVFYGLCDLDSFVLLEPEEVLTTRVGAIEGVTTGGVCMSSDLFWVEDLMARIEG